jgi:hypothetical protein
MIKKLLFRFIHMLEILAHLVSQNARIFLKLTIQSFLRGERKVFCVHYVAFKKELDNEFSLLTVYSVCSLTHIQTHSPTPTHPHLPASIC